MARMRAAPLDHMIVEQQPAGDGIVTGSDRFAMLRPPRFAQQRPLKHG